MQQSDTVTGGSEQRRFHLDRKLTVAISFFAVAGLLLILLSNLATTTMSSLRAYSTLQGNWTREREDAAFYLHDYIDEGDASAIDSFKTSIEYIRRVKEARELMEQADPDYKTVRRNLRRSGNHPEDIDGMIQTYRGLHEFRYFEQVVELWERSDSLVYEMDTLASRAIAGWENEQTLKPQRRNRLKQQVLKLDHQLTVAQKGINAKLGLGVRMPESLDFESSQSLGITMIRTLTQQLEGNIDISDDKGTTYEIQFRKKPPSFYQTATQKVESM